jgi:hypothetical protein
LEAVRAAVRAIPPGETSTYGEVAAASGIPGRARLVGRILAEDGHDLPWHRVLRADGTCAAHRAGAAGPPARGRRPPGPRPKARPGVTPSLTSHRPVCFVATWSGSCEDAWLWAKSAYATDVRSASTAV